MMGKEKHRAARNQTLTVTAGEIPSLEPMVSAVGDLRAGFRDDMLVNGDLLECLDLISDGFFDLILLAATHPTIQGYADGVFWERNSVSS